MALNKADDYQLFEYACHEGNYGLYNVGTRLEEKRSAEAAARGEPTAQKTS